MTKRTKEESAYWKDTSRHDWGTALSLFKSKRYDACLFFCHLSLEKLLKGLVVEKTGEPAPYTHDLAHLAVLAATEATEEQIKSLRAIATFNIAGRYDNIKRAFYKKCTKEYTEENLKKAKELYVWLEKNK